MRRILQDDPETSQSALEAQLAALQLGSGPIVQAEIARNYLAMRREALYSRVRRELLSQSGTLEQLRARVLTKSDSDLSTTVTHVFQEEYEHASAEIALRQFEANVPPGIARPADQPDDQPAHFDSGPARRRAPLFLIIPRSRMGRCEGSPFSWNMPA